MRRILVVAFVLAVPALAASLGHAAGPPPVPIDAETGDDGDGFIDRITVTFNTALDTTSQPTYSNSGTGPGFHVPGYTISGVTIGTPASVVIVSLQEKTTPDTGVIPTLTYATGGGVQTPPPLQEELAAGAIAVGDGAGPVIVSMSAKDLSGGGAGVFTAVGEEVYITFSEPTRLAGTTKTERWSNLEKAIFFQNVVTEGGACATDGDGGVANFNFPQPDATKPQAADPISAPAAGQSATTFHVIKTPETVSGSKKFPAVPVGCWVGVDPDLADRSVLTDAANNTAVGMDQPAAAPTKIRINPLDAVVQSVRTADGRIGAPDGLVDAIELTFDQRIDDATILSHIDRFSVSLGSTTAVIDASAVDTGATADDATFYLPITLPEGTTWNGGTRPTVAYTKPSSCTPSAGAGIKAIVPSGGTWRACVASFSTLAADGVKPVLLSYRTLDQTANGKIDGVRATFTEAIASGTTAGWTLDGRAANGFAIDGADPKKVTISFNEGATTDTGALPALAYAVQGGGGSATADAAGNQPTLPVSVTKIDGAAPRIKGATVYDLNGDGNVERAVVEFTESIVDPSEAAAGNVAIGGVAASIAAPHDGDDDPDAANDHIASFAVAGLTGTDAKAIDYTSGDSAIEDAAGNAIVAQTLAAASVVDEAAPRAEITIAPIAPMKAGTSTVTATFSEDMDITIVPSTATLGTKNLSPKADADHTNGWVNADHRVWEGTVTIEAGDCAVATGCDVTATVDGGKDARANSQGAAATRLTQIDTIAPTAPVLGSFAATVTDGESVPANTINMFTEAFSVGATIGADAPNGFVEILVDGTALTPAADAPAVEGAVTPATAFDDAAALQAAIAEGAHTITVQTCDAALNCTASTTSVDVAADYTPVEVELTTPTGGEIVAGGQTLDVTWNGDEAGEGFDHVQVEYATDGSTYATIADDLTLDGTNTWTTPTIESGDVTVRAVAVDVNGNKGYAASDTLTIDSLAPVVSITAPTSSNPFLPAGSAYTIRWTATDASIDAAENPITIEYSYNNGRTWRPIDGGSYSKANDGRETWNVPNGGSFSYKVRVTAADAVGHTTTTLSSKLAKGVSGYVVDRRGYIYGYGTANTTTNEYTTSSWDRFRGIALRDSGTAGYVVDYRGRVYPFSIGSASRPAKPSATKFSGDSARGIVLRTDTSGYVLHRNGKLYRFGGAPSARVSKYWRGKSVARAVVMLENGRGGYVLDKYGRLWPFAVGSYRMPPSLQGRTLFSGDDARGVVLRDDQKSGWILRKTGKLYAFGGAPSVSNAGTSSRAYAKAIVRVTNYGGYWIDNKGVLRAWGSGFGNPTKKVMSYNYARGAA